MNKRRLAAIARWLEAGAPEKKHVKRFDMNATVQYLGFVHAESPDKLLGCGTACCIAGAATQFFNKPLDLAKNFLSGDARYMNSGHLTWGLIDKEATELLDLNADQARALFTPWEVEVATGFIATSDYSNPAWAARVIRRLIKTGVVDWAACKDAS